MILHSNNIVIIKLYRIKTLCSHTLDRNWPRKRNAEICNNQSTI